MIEFLLKLKLIFLHGFVLARGYNLKFNKLIIGSNNFDIT